MKFFEYNFDGLVGPTHNYAGLSYGNVASKSNAQSLSNPKQAVLQGLEKMKALSDRGYPQGLLPPNARPDLQTLRRLGFSGDLSTALEKASQQAPQAFASCFSASSMWTANAATVSPSADTVDHKVHFTPANLCNKFHRFIEPEQTGRILKSVFSSEKHFVHHPHIPSHEWFGDEGAANHTRFCTDYGTQGIEFFVFGRYADSPNRPAPKKYPARQTLEASQAVARLHQLSDPFVVYAQQNPDVIDTGVFHNDVIAVGNKNVLFYHEKAFENLQETQSNIKRAWSDTQPFHFVEVSESEVSVLESVKTYLFNSQLLANSDGTMTLVVPGECEESPAVWTYLQSLTQSGGPISEVLVYDVKQSMRNGGGPACLRLRVVLSEEEVRQVAPQCLMGEEIYSVLVGWANKHYRDRLSFDDLRDPQLVQESFTALDELTQILKLGSIYDFQLESP
ncbi:MAG: N-succinylarginine dihydrolase [Bdellovibrionales bacterium]|nr:N-succinylarginine dihydrolase [Bdellovibrionales bacterium]